MYSQLQMDIGLWYGNLANLVRHSKYWDYYKPEHEILVFITYGPRRGKTSLRGFRQSEFQAGLLSYRD